MKKVTTVLLLSLLLLSISSLAGAVDNGYANSQFLISVDQLKTKLDNKEDVRVIAVTGKVNYTKAHIPGAVKVEHGEMASSEAELPNMRLTPAGFVKLMEEKGVNNDTQLVVYDHSGGLWAARLWWQARMYGHQQVQLLDGGFSAWQKAGYDVEHFASSVDKGNYEVTEVKDDYVISTEEVKSKLGREDFNLIDARSKAEYTGEKTFGGADRKGHIPHAVHIEWNRNLAEDGTLKSAEELKQLYEGYGITPDKEVAMYCHTAVRSAHTFFVLRLLGYEEVANYDAAWVGWANDKSLAIE